VVIHPGTDRTVSSRSSISRRSLLISGIAGAAAYALPSVARAAAQMILASDSVTRRFSVFYTGVRIGTHTVAYSAANGQSKINTEIYLVVNVLTDTIYAYEHRSEEIWRDGRLTSMNSETTDHGKKFQVMGAETDQGFRVVSEGGPFIAPAATLTSNSLWTPAVLEQKTLVDAQFGGIIGVAARKFRDEQIVIADRYVHAARYRFITPYLAGSLWYDDGGLWVHGEFERDGVQIVYQLDM
jgi:hypothetical protein